MGKIFILALSILMPGDKPDINHIRKMDSLEECWDAAKEYMSHDMSDELRAHGAVGTAAGCSVQPAPSQSN